MKNKPAREILAIRLMRLREKNGLTQQELADKLHITRQSLSLYECAERTINIDMLLEISRFFGVSTDYLLGVSNVITTDENIKTATEDLGISEKSAENIRAITQNGGNVDILLERDVFNNIVELLNKIKTKTVIDLFWNTRSLQFDEIGKFFCNANKQMLEFIQGIYAYSIIVSISQPAKEVGSGKLNSEDQVIIWEYCLLQREMRKLLDDIESDKPEYKGLFSEYDNSVEEHLKKTLIEKENELCNSTAANNKELEQNIKALKQLIDFYHEHIRKGVTPNG